MFDLLVTELSSKLLDLQKSSELFYTISQNRSHSIQESYQLLATRNPSHVTTKGVIKIPPKQNKALLYAELERSKKDEEVIFQLISTLAENTKFWLLLHRSEVTQLGEEISHVHPLKFLGAIYSNPQLKLCMKKVLDDYFKKNRFIDGLGAGLESELKKDAIYQYLQDFCKEVNYKPYEIEPFIQSRDWEGMLSYMANH